MAIDEAFLWVCGLALAKSCALIRARFESAPLAPNLPLTKHSRRDDYLVLTVA